MKFHGEIMDIIKEKQDASEHKNYLMLVQLDPENGDMAVGSVNLDAEDREQVFSHLAGKRPVSQVKVKRIEIGMVNTMLGIVLGCAISILMWELWGLLK